jgi:thiol-disulfide isomerase/thioredoxin
MFQRMVGVVALSGLAAAAITCAGVGLLTPATMAARPGQAAEVGAKDDQPAGAPGPAAEEKEKRTPDSAVPLREAVEELNRRINKMNFGQEFPRQPALARARWPKPVTVEEVVSAIRNWDRKQFPVEDTTYQIFKRIANSKALPPRARLGFLDQWGLGQRPDTNDKYEYRVCYITLDVMTGKGTGYSFGVRHERLDRRIALRPAPGYSWLVGPVPASPRGSYQSRLLVFALDDDKETALLITVAYTKKGGVHDLRAVAFDKDGNRYLMAHQRGWGNGNSELALLRFRLNPKKLPAALAKYVGIEGITREGLKFASEAAVKRANEKGIEVLPFPQVGKPYEFSLTASDGNAIDSRKLRGKVVLIDCWASWCWPCLRDMPDVKRMHEKYHDKGLEVIGLSLDEDPKPAAAAVQKHAMPWRIVVVPPGEEVRELWTQAARIESIPRLLVLDRKGILRADLSRPRDLERIVLGLLAESPPAP